MKSKVEITATPLAAAAASMTALLPPTASQSPPVIVAPPPPPPINCRTRSSLSSSPQDERSAIPAMNITGINNGHCERMVMKCPPTVIPIDFHQTSDPCPRFPPSGREGDGSHRILA